MKGINKEFIQKTVLIVATGCIGILFVMKFDKAVGFVQSLYNAISPLLFGIVLAFVLNVILKQIESVITKWCGETRPWIRPVSVAATYILSLIVVIVLMYIIIPQLWNSMIMLANNLPTYVTTIVGLINDLLEQMGFAARINLDDIFSVPMSEVGTSLAKWIEQLMPTIYSWLGDIDPKVVSDIGALTMQILSVLVRLLLSIIFSVYVLLSKEKFVEQLDRINSLFMPVNTARRMRYVASRAGQIFSDFVSGQLMEMMILGTIFFVVLSVSGLPYALLIAVIIALTSIIPYFGTTVAMIFGAVLILAESGLMPMIIFIVEFIVIQQLENNLIYPHVVGQSVGLPAIWVLVSVTVFGSLLGVTGLIAGVPLMALIYSLCQELIRKKYNSLDSNS